MDCPHCATENLVGSRICAACGKSMLSPPPGFGPPQAATEPARPGSAAKPAQAAPPVPPAAPAPDRPTPPPRAQRSATVRSMSDEMTQAPATWGRGGPAAPAAAPEPEQALQVMCRVCRSHVDAKDASDTGICASCRALSAQVEQMAPTDVQMVPQSDFEAEAEFRNRMGSSNLRPKPVAVRKVGLRTGAVAAIVGFVLVVAGLGVVLVMSHETDRAGEILGKTTAGEAFVTADPGEEFRPRHTATVRMRVLREESRAFGGTASKRSDFLQVTALDSEAAIVREEDEGDVYDVRCTGRVIEQTGTAEGEDAHDANLFPWFGTQAPFRVRAPDNRPPVQLDGAPVIPGRDVIPLFHLGALAAPGRTFRTGDRWKTEITFPSLTDRQGRLLSWPVPVEVAYAGIATRLGSKCAAFKITGTPPKTLPGPLDDAYNRRDGKVAGAVWIELASGLVQSAEIETDFRLWKEAGKVEEMLTLQGRLSIERK